MLSGRRVLLIIGGGIAAYKALELSRRLQERGLRVRAILTAAGAQFITPLSVGALTGEKVYQDLFDLTDEAEMGHIQLSRDADLIVVAPATANLMARMAAGLADDLASTVLLATDKPVLMAPAMNVRMWLHPATQRNVARLLADGIRMVGPEPGKMACHEYGPGRLSEPMDIVHAVEAFFESAGPRPLAGKRIIVTAGPTHEPIDPVRYIANRSSGKQGFAIAEALAGLGADVRLISGPTNLSPPRGVTFTLVETASEMAGAVRENLPADGAILAAAVADWRVAYASDAKLKKSKAGPPSLDLVENPDILADLCQSPMKPKLVVGFAAETEAVSERAAEKRRKKGSDWIIANDVSPKSGIMGGDENEIHLITAQGAETWPRLAKFEVARRLAAKIAEALNA